MEQKSNGTYIILVKYFVKPYNYKIIKNIVFCVKKKKNVIRYKIKTHCKTYTTGEHNAFEQ